MSDWLVVVASVVTSVLAVLTIEWMRPRMRQERPSEPLEDTPAPSHDPLPVDASNPPSWRVYRPKPGRAPLSCTCHPDRALVAGQSVLWWPLDNGQVVVFCEEGIEEQ